MGAALEKSKATEGMREISQPSDHKLAMIALSASIRGFSSAYRIAAKTACVSDWVIVVSMVRRNAV
jgi:hypothetical protein